VTFAKGVIPTSTIVGYAWGLKEGLHGARTLVLTGKAATDILLVSGAAHEVGGMTLIGTKLGAAGGVTLTLVFAVGYVFGDYLYDHHVQCWLWY
jgi:hypothetical protein